MKVEKYINTTEENISSRKHNILIPICLGNKFFADKNIINKNVEKYISWALKHTKDKVLVLVADKIQDTNYYVRNKHRTKVASRRAVLKDGIELTNNIEELSKKFSQDKWNRIDIIRWEEYEKEDPFYKHTRRLVYEEFKNNKNFRDGVLNAVKTSITDREFTEEEYLKLCNYVLDEFSLAYSGTVYKKNYYGIYIYPETDSVVRFIEKIQGGKIFQELHNMLPEEKMALIILN